MTTLLRTLGAGLAWLPVAGTLFVAGLILTLSQAYVAVAADLPGGLPGARMAASEPGGDLVVTAVPEDPQFLDLTPGDSRFWTVEASLEQASSGRLSMRVFGAGAVVEHARSGLTIAVESCSRAYASGSSTSRPVCGSAPTQVISTTNLASISSDPGDATSPRTWVLPDIHRSVDRHFLVTLAIPSDGESDKTLMGLSGSFGLGLFASGVDTPPAPIDVERPRPTTSLPDTGGPALALLLLGLGAVSLGLAVRARAHRGSEATP